MQLFFVQGNKAYLGSNLTQFRSNIGWLRPTPFLMGVPKINTDLQAPSRAFKKLEEIFSLMVTSRFDPRTQEPLFPKDRLCVELGSAPGGWTKKLLDKGVCVVSVDRSSLAPAILQHRNYHSCLLNHYQTDAFLWRPSPEISSNIEWVFCDLALDAQVLLLVPLLKSNFLRNPWNS